MKQLSHQINESLLTEDAKDIQRVKDIITKSAGNEAKATQLATTMAHAITDKQKALNRGLAAKDMLGDTHPVTLAFLGRATELGVNVEHEKTRTHVLLGSKRPKQAGTPRVPYRSSHTGATPILPCGSLNFTTGENKYFNVKQNGESCLEIWKSTNHGNKFYCVITSGKTPICHIGQYNPFSHDQTGRPLFEGVMVDYIEHDHMDELIPVYGKSMLQYVYK